MQEVKNEVENEVKREVKEGELKEIRGQFITTTPTSEEDKTMREIIKKERRKRQRILKEVKKKLRYSYHFNQYIQISHYQKIIHNIKNIF